jgi:HAD superfamily hydrolase (TIGR01484 family)
MPPFTPNPDIPPRVLATDLDGTFIPLPDHPENRDALETFRAARAENRIGLVFATGRHLESVLDAMRAESLPSPDWIVCDVGTSIHRRDGAAYVPYAPFEATLAERTCGATRADVETLLAPLPGLALQSPERQRRFKISYFCPPEDLQRLADLADQRLADAHLPYACLASLDPFHGVGLLDVLPAGASKADALLWLATHADFSPDEVVFSGDSGNDLAALACGFRAIVVANATPGLADRALRQLEDQRLSDRLFCATLPATSGVLQGCRHFGLPGLAPLAQTRRTS